MNDDYPESEPRHVSGDVEAAPAPAPERQGVPLPLHRPRATFALLGVIGVVFVLQLLSDTLRMNPSITVLGSEINALVASGDYWRLLTAMFLHYGVAHIAFNAWALLSLGQEVEAYFGTPRFLVVYFVGGLFSGVVSYVLPPASWLLIPSAGASGAIFAIVGADVAFFLLNRRGLGQLGQRQLLNLAILIGINLVIGFTPGAGINNYAHLGGLVGGFLLGIGLAPRYSVTWNGYEPRLVDNRPAGLQFLIVAAMVVLLFTGIYLGNLRWAPYLPGLF